MLLCDVNYIGGQHQWGSQSFTGLPDRIEAKYIPAYFASESRRLDWFPKLPTGVVLYSRAPPIIISSRALITSAKRLLSSNRRRIDVKHRYVIVTMYTGDQNTEALKSTIVDSYRQFQFMACHGRLSVDKTTSSRFDFWIYTWNMLLSDLDRAPLQIYPMGPKRMLCHLTIS